jgi:phosphoribosyl-AMP cyclohydrolase
MSRDTIITDDWLDSVRFDAAGLVTAIAQDHVSQRILMVAWMNAEALRETATTGWATYFSRSRQCLWRKGEESGNRQRVQRIQLDCDGDTIVLQVEQHGGVACHTGRASCFFYELNDGGTNTPPHWVLKDPVLVSPSKLYK